MATAPLLAELPEDQATGRIAGIYAEIRRFSGVPYVSSLQRHLATFPGMLEWAWAALRPAMVAGAIQEAGWRLAGMARLPPAAPVPAATLFEWEIDAASLAAIRAAAETFARVAPVNLVMGACLKRLLAGERPAGGGGFPTGWTPPPPLPAVPATLDPASLDPARRALLMRLATTVGETPFVPGLYRQCAHWPGLLQWLADTLAPRFAAPETLAAGEAFRAAARAAAQGIVTHLPPLAGAPPADARTLAGIGAAIDRYGQTSPELALFGRLILDALPERTG